jgi:hypothetical protein
MDITEYEMVAGITGEISVVIDAAEALLDWFLPENCLLVIAYPPTPVIEEIVQWCDIVGQKYATTTEYLPEILCNYGDPAVGGSDKIDLALIVLGIEGRQQVIRDTWDRGIEVYDLTRAMYEVTEGDDLGLAVYEPQTQSHEVSDGLGGRGSLDIFAPQNRSESRTTWTRQELEEIMAGIVRVHEERYHSNLDPVLDGAITKLPVSKTDGGKIRCLRKKNGEIRVSPRAKAKLDEEEIWLTQEEYEASL